MHSNSDFYPLINLNKTIYVSYSKIEIYKYRMNIRSKMSNNLTKKTYAGFMKNSA